MTTETQTENPPTLRWSADGATVTLVTSDPSEWSDLVGQELTVASCGGWTPGRVSFGLACECPHDCRSGWRGTVAAVERP